MKLYLPRDSGPCHTRTRMLQPEGEPGSLVEVKLAFWCSKEEKKWYEVACSLRTEIANAKSNSRRMLEFMGTPHGAPFPWAAGSYLIYHTEQRFCFLVCFQVDCQLSKRRHKDVTAILSPITSLPSEHMPDLRVSTQLFSLQRLLNPSSCFFPSCSLFCKTGENNYDQTLIDLNRRWIQTGRHKSVFLHRKSSMALIFVVVDDDCIYFVISAL